MGGTMSAYVYNILNSSKYVVTLTTDVLVPKVLSKPQNRDITRSPTPAEMCPMVFTAHAPVSG